MDWEKIIVTAVITAFTTAIVNAAFGSLFRSFFRAVWKKIKNATKEKWKNPRSNILHFIKQRAILAVIRSNGKRKQERIKKHSKVHRVLEFGILQEVKSYYIKGLSVEEQAYIDFYVLGVKDKLSMSRSFEEVRAKNYVNKKLYMAVKDYHDEWVKEEAIRIESSRTKAEARAKDIELISHDDMLKRLKDLTALVKKSSRE
jgi:hypothetical protein